MHVPIFLHLKVLSFVLISNMLCNCQISSPFILYQPNTLPSISLPFAASPSSWNSLLYAHSSFDPFRKGQNHCLNSQSQYRLVQKMSDIFHNWLLSTSLYIFISLKRKHP